MKYIKAVLNTIDTFIGIFVYIVVGIFALMLIAGNATVGCNKAMFSNTTSCAATVIIPAK